MKFCSTLFLLAILLSAATALPARADDAKVTQIKLQHTQCEGTCPIDELTLNADGSAQFAGDRNSARTGFYRGQIAPAAFAELARALEDQNFFELRPQIGDGLTTDAPDAIVSATRAGSMLDAPHSVVFRASGNRELLEKLESVFESASAQIDWKKDEAASQSGARGTLTRALTPHELRLFADRDFKQLRMRYALVELISMGETQTVYSTHSDGEGNFQIFAPPGRYLVSANDSNAAYAIENWAYLPHWGSDAVAVEVPKNQFAPVEIGLRDYNENTKPKVAEKLK